LARVVLAEGGFVGACCRVLCLICLQLWKFVYQSNCKCMTANGNHSCPSAISQCNRGQQRTAKFLQAMVTQAIRIRGWVKWMIHTCILHHLLSRTPSLTVRVQGPPLMNVSSHEPRNRALRAKCELVLKLVLMDWLISKTQNLCKCKFPYLMEICHQKTHLCIFLSSTSPLISPKRGARNHVHPVVSRWQEGQIMGQRLRALLQSRRWEWKMFSRESCNAICIFHALSRLWESISCPWCG